jgi:O-antigen ligase
MLLQQNHTEFYKWWLPGLAAAASIVAGVVLEENILIALPFVVVVVLLIVPVEIRQLFFLLLFFIPLSTEYNVTGSLSTDFPDEGLMLLLTGAIFAFSILKPGFFPSELKYSSLFLIVLVQLLWICITILFSYQPVLSIKYALAKVWYIVPFIVGTQLFLKTREDYTKASKALIFAMLIPIILSLIRHALTGFTFESVNFTLNPFFRNHVSYSAMIVCLIPVLFVWYYFEEGIIKKGIVFLIVLFLAALFFSYSRGAWLCIISGYIAWWAIRKKMLLKLLALATVISIISVSWLIAEDNYMRFAPDYNKTYFRTNFGEHMQATYQLKDISTMERFYRWVAGIRMIGQEPLTGFGPNTFYRNYKQYTVASFKTWVSANEEKSTVHNYFLLVTIEQGFLGLLLFCCLLYFMFATVVKAWHTLSDSFDRVLAMVCGVVLTMILTLNLLSDLIETDKTGGLFFLILGILIQLQLKMKAQHSQTALL